MLPCVDVNVFYVPPWLSTDNKIYSLALKNTQNLIDKKQYDNCITIKEFFLKE